MVQPGSVGGALIGGDGQLRGIVVGMQSRTPDAGPAIALHVSRLDRILRAAEDRDAQQPATVLTRGVLGVTLRDDQGTRVGRVAEDSPAATAGINPGDKITGINGQRVQRLLDLFGQLSHYRGGDQVTVELQRDGEPLELELQLQSAPVHRSGPVWAGGSLRILPMGRDAAQWTPRAVRKNGDVVIPVPPEDVEVMLDTPRAGDAIGPTYTVVPHLRVERTNLEQSIQALHEEIRQLRQQFEKMQPPQPQE